jgi:iron complex transport system ATP-binding protein
MGGGPTVVRQVREVWAKPPAQALVLRGLRCVMAPEPANAGGAADVWGPFDAALQRGTSVAWTGSDPGVLDALLRTVLGEMPVGQGEVEVCGRPLADWPLRELACRRAVLGPDEPGGEGLLVGVAAALGRVARWPDPGQEWIVRDALREAGLPQRTLERVGHLPPLERLQLRLARLMAQLWDHAHGLIVLNRALDVKALGGIEPVRELLQRLLAFARERGHAVVLVQPDVPQLMAQLERVWLIGPDGVQADLVSRVLPAAWLNDDITRLGSQLLRFG